jgi:hypothetical protein
MILHAIASPTLEVYITTYPVALHRTADPYSGLQLIDPSIAREPLIKACSGSPRGQLTLP